MGIHRYAMLAKCFIVSKLLIKMALRMDTKGSLHHQINGNHLFFEMQSVYLQIAILSFRCFGYLNVKGYNQKSNSNQHSISEIFCNGKCVCFPELGIPGYYPVDTCSLQNVILPLRCLSIPANSNITSVQSFAIEIFWLHKINWD